MSKPWTATSLLALAWASVTGIGTPRPSVPPPPAGAGMRLRFVGNSLTHTHDIPARVRQLAVAAGRPAPITVMRASGNAGPEDHWLQGTVRQGLKTGQFDVLIMQQGPSTLAASGENLTHWTRILAAEAVTHGTRPGLYAGSAPADGNFMRGMEHYRVAAEVTQIAFYPASCAWKLAWDQQSRLARYGADGFHPSPAGAVLSAMVIAAVIFEIDPATMPNLRPADIPEAEAANMRGAASSAVRAQRKRCGVSGPRDVRREKRKRA